MEKKNYTLKPIWEKFDTIFSSDELVIDNSEVIRHISESLIVGDFYYYVIDIPKQALSCQHANLCEIHSLSEVPQHLQEIIDLIHPDDLDFVLMAEEFCYKELMKLGTELVPDFKSSYCFRMQTGEGDYQMFHHQAITLGTDSKKRILKSLNIHTNINYISPTNSYQAYLSGINGRTDFYKFDLTDLLWEKKNTMNITKRELDIIECLAKGYCSERIGQELGISPETVKAHRKNLLRKTETYNSAALIKKCGELGLISI